MVSPATVSAACSVFVRFVSCFLATGGETGVEAVAVAVAVRFELAVLSSDELMARRLDGESSGFSSESMIVGL